MLSLLISALLAGFAGMGHAAEDGIYRGLTLPLPAQSADSRQKADVEASKEARLIRRYKEDIADCRKNVGGERKACESLVRSQAHSKARREVGHLPLILQRRSAPRRKARGRRAGRFHPGVPG